jgi:hypothetical protein
LAKAFLRTIPWASTYPKKKCGRFGWITNEIDMTEEAILDAYHLACTIHKEQTGESFPLTRVSCVSDEYGTITDTSGNIVATFNLESPNAPDIELVKTVHVSFKWDPHDHATDARAQQIFADFGCDAHWLDTVYGMGEREISGPVDVRKAAACVRALDEAGFELASIISTIR